jgi:hypothetical protein
VNILKVIDNREKEHASGAIVVTDGELQGNDDGTGKRRLAFLDLLLDMKRKGEMSVGEVREQTDTFMFEVWGQMGFT